MIKRRPSVLYTSDPELHDPELGDLFLSGELPFCAHDARIRELALFWRGVEAELRTREAAALGPHLAALLEHLTGASHAFDALSSAVEDLSEEWTERAHEDEEAAHA